MKTVSQYPEGMFSWVDMNSTDTNVAQAFYTAQPISDSDDGESFYRLATIYDMQQQIDEAAFWIKKSIRAGYYLTGLLVIDSNLKNIQASAYYNDIIQMNAALQ